jgi:hypothetical protein
MIVITKLKWKIEIVLDPFTTTMLKTHNHPCLGVFIKSIATSTITTKIFGICVIGHYGIVMVVKVQLWFIFTQHITVLMHQTIFKYFIWQLVDVQRFVFTTIVIYFPPNKVNKLFLRGKVRFTPSKFVIYVFFHEYDIEINHCIGF